MIHSILHQIWNQRRSNGWLFAELLIVFTLMWYCVDVLSMALPMQNGSLRGMIWSMSIR